LKAAISRIGLQSLVETWRRTRHGRRARYPELWRPVERAGSRWHDALATARSGPKVLVATSLGGHLAAMCMESLLAVALTLRGANVHVLLCDEVLPACLNCERDRMPTVESLAQDGPQPHICRSCFGPGEALFRELGVTVHRYGEFLTAADHSLAAKFEAALPRDGIVASTYERVGVGEQAMASAIRYFARGDIFVEVSAEAVLRRYLRAAVLTTIAVRRLIHRERFDRSVFHHGIYVPQGLIGAVARQEQMPVVNWSTAYRKGCFVFSHGDTYHFTMLTEPTETWESLPWSPALEHRTLDYLNSRRQGSKDWVSYQRGARQDADTILRECGLDPSKPTIGLLTNVTWDAQVFYRNSAYPTMTEWMLDSIAHFATRPELQLIIRVHPAEVQGSVVSRQNAVDEIRRAFPTLPSNIAVIGPESQVGTYALMEHCDTVLIYATKAGVECAALGLPVIVAGDAWVREKGITQDPTTKEGYRALLARLPRGTRLDEAMQHRALKYAYHFFFRRCIPIEAMALRPGWPPYMPEVNDIDELLPGHDRGLDIICDGILNATAFIYPDECDVIAAAAPNPDKPVLASASRGR
jgi:hypothetical protein